MRDHYTCKGKPRIISLYTELTPLKKEQNEGVTNYVIRTEATVTTLRNARETLSDGLIIAIVLKGRPSTFNLYYMITGRKPDLSMMNIFGSTCYTYKNLKKKQDPKGDIRLL